MCGRVSRVRESESALYVCNAYYLLVRTTCAVSYTHLDVYKRQANKTNKTGYINEIISIYRRQWWDHLQRTTEDRLPKAALNYKVIGRRDVYKRQRMHHNRNYWHRLGWGVVQARNWAKSRQMPPWPPRHGSTHHGGLFFRPPSVRLYVPAGECLRASRIYLYVDKNSCNSEQ